MVSYKCSFCARRDNCKQKPTSGFINVTKKTGMCFSDQKLVDKVKRNPLQRGKRRKKKVTK